MNQYMGNPTSFNAAPPALGPAAPFQSSNNMSNFPANPFFSNNQNPNQNLPQQFTNLSLKNQTPQAGNMWQ